MLRPVETQTREIKKLDGLSASVWNSENCGIDQRWWESALQESRAIAVPGSFNDQFADADIRNYAGNVVSPRSLYTERLGRPAYRAAFRCGHSLRQSVGQ